MQRIDELTLGLDGSMSLQPFRRGKKHAGLHCCVDNARGGSDKTGDRYPAIIYSFEMSVDRLNSKVLSQFTGKLSSTEILLGRTLDRSKVDWACLERAKREYEQFADYIQFFLPTDFQDGVTPELFPVAIHAAKRTHGKDRVLSWSTRSRYGRTAFHTENKLYFFKRTDRFRIRTERCIYHDQLPILWLAAKPRFKRKRGKWIHFYARWNKYGADAAFINSRRRKTI
jgi:hypothetical protein